ncbi:MAG: cysteine synthase A [Magnetococcus sp. DMHC-6]
MGKIYNNITETIGHTPLVRLNKVTAGLNCDLLAKLEFFNPLASLKDRIGLAMIQAAEADGRLNPNSVIIEPTSGNTGISLAFICASRGYRLILTMPESMSEERHKMFLFLGAEVILTPAREGMRGAIERAYEIKKKIPNSFIPNQFENPANPDIHARTTAQELIADTDGQFDALVAGVGTGGCLTGLARTLKKQMPQVRIVAVEPESSPVLSGGMPGPHRIQGIGAGFIPPVLDRNCMDEIVRVSDERAMEMARRCAREEGIPGGISSGATVAAALELATRPDWQNKRFVVIFASFAERYLSTDLFEKLEK